MYDRFAPNPFAPVLGDVLKNPCLEKERAVFERAARAATIVSNTTAIGASFIWAPCGAAAAAAITIGAAACWLFREINGATDCAFASHWLSVHGGDALAKKPELRALWSGAVVGVTRANGAALLLGGASIPFTASSAALGAAFDVLAEEILYVPDPNKKTQSRCAVFKEHFQRRFAARIKARAVFFFGASQKAEDAMALRIHQTLLEKRSAESCLSPESLKR